ncbi:MAG: hypothetical protein A2X96_12100 [Syntrophobacterales bacterium GWC2_56_13]|nr:MAG: hypothetical protein A2X96_12100 [Syntrophobacterales bacterium GWC2_56_13]OHE19349.1 MAG: hypothetical protein A2X95_09090 [Syntrophobacterales bacterium GWF2_56_9]
MNRKRVYKTFIHKEAVFRICCESFGAVTQEIVRQRAILEDYIRRDPHFQHSLQPVAVKADALEVARRMARAASKVGVGPMAAVAGAMAQLAVEAGLQAGTGEVIVDNGGDIYLQTTGPVIIGLYPGGSGPIGRLAFSLQACDTPPFHLFVLGGNGPLAKLWPMRSGHRDRTGRRTGGRRGDAGRQSRQDRRRYGAGFK